MERVFRRGGGPAHRCAEIPDGAHPPRIRRRCLGRVRDRARAGPRSRSADPWCLRRPAVVPRPRSGGSPRGSSTRRGSIGVSMGRGEATCMTQPGPRRRMIPRRCRSPPSTSSPPPRTPASPTALVRVIIAAASAGLVANSTPSGETPSAAAVRVLHLGGGQVEGPAGQSASASQVSCSERLRRARVPMGSVRGTKAVQHDAPGPGADRVNAGPGGRTDPDLDDEASASLRRRS